MDFEKGLIYVRQRISYGADIDSPKSQKRVRDVPMGHLQSELRLLCTGTTEAFIFRLPSSHHGGRPRQRDDGVTTDQAWSKRYLVPAMKAAGCYRPGMGWHTFRREGIAAAGVQIGALAAARLAGHSRVDQSLVYTLADMELQRAHIEARQVQLMGKEGGKVQ